MIVATKHVALVIWGLAWLCAGLPELVHAQEEAAPGSEPVSAPAAEQEVTTADVKRFLDPTVMINNFDYSFGANFLPGEARLYHHRLQPFWALNRWTGVWAAIPVNNFSLPDGDGPAGIGDVLLGWGAVTHENLASRVTASGFFFEVLAPTGDVEKGTGSGTWILAPSGAVALNPTDVFPIYVTARYLHSLESLAGSDRNQQVTDDPALRLRSLELTIETVQVLPGGFFLVAAPSFLFNFNQDFNVFSIGLGVGRAISRSFALSGAYVHRVAGRKTFNQAFNIQLQYIFGQRKDQ